MKLNYYARLKEDDVCIEIVSTPKNLRGVKGYIPITDYNETLLYRKYDENLGWSEERFEPEVDVVLQERLNNLEEENIGLNQTVSNLNKNIILLEGTISELTMILGGMQQ